MLHGVVAGSAAQGSIGGGNERYGSIEKAVHFLVSMLR